MRSRWRSPDRTPGPAVEQVRRLWHDRQGGRPTPLLVVVAYQEGDRTCASVCGPVGRSPTVESGLALEQVERLAAAALREPSRHAAVRFLVGMLDGLRADLIPGLRNGGLLATQELKAGVPQRRDWTSATSAGGLLLGLRGQRLLEGLGFTVERLSTTGTVLRVGQDRRAVALFLDETESFDDAGLRFNATSPVTHGLALAAQEHLPWVVLTRGHQVRLYAARPDTGVGRRGWAETFVELNLALLPGDAAGYLPLLIGAGALVDGGTLEQILVSSADFAADLGTRLRERLYDAVPALATAVARAGDPDRLTEADLGEAYDNSLTLLFRLLFVAYA